MANTPESAPNYGNEGNKRRSAEGANVLSESFFSSLTFLASVLLCTSTLLTELRWASVKNHVF